MCEEARAKQDMRSVHLVGIDETSVRRGQNYIIVVHDPDDKWLLFATPERDHETVEQFAVELQAHDGKRTAIDPRVHGYERAQRPGDRQILAQRTDQLRPLPRCGTGQQSDG